LEMVTMGRKGLPRSATHGCRPQQP